MSWMTIIVNPLHYTMRGNIRPKSLKATKYSGGIAVGFHNPIKAGVEVLKCNSTSALWLRLKEVFFDIERDLYIGGVYTRPRHPRILH